MTDFQSPAITSGSLPIPQPKAPDIGGLLQVARDAMEPVPFAPQEPQGNEFDALVIRQRRAREQQVEQQLQSIWRVAVNSDPDEAARAVNIARELGLPTTAVADNMEVAREALKRRAVQFQELQRQYPTLLTRMGDIDFVRLAHDDVGNLKATESTWEWLGRQTEAGFAANQRGYLGVRRALGWMTPEEQVELDRLNVSMREAGQDSGIAAATAQTLGQMAGTVPVALGAGAAAAGLASLGGPIGAGTAFTGASAAAGFSLSAMIEGGNAYEDMLAQGIDKDTAAKAAFGVVAPVNGALEMVGMHYFAAPFKTAFGKLAVRKVSQKLASETAASAFNRFAIAYGKSYLSEIGTEVLQEAVSMSAGGVARQVSRPDLPAMSWADIMGQLGEIAGKTAQGMLLPALPGPAFQFVGDSITARQSLVEQQFLKDAIQQQGESKVAKRAPNARLEFLAATARGSDGATAYVRTQTALDALRQDGLTIEDLAAKSPEIAEKLNEAREKGLESASFPTATYIGKLQGTTFGETLLPHLRLSEASMSLEELRQFAKDEPKRTAEAAALIEAYKATSKEWADSSATVRETYRTQILQAGRSEQEASTVASFITAFAETQAYGLGITPSEFVARFPLQVVRGAVASQETFQQTKTDSPEFRAWFGESKVVDEKGAPLVVYHGTGPSWRGAGVTTEFDTSGSDTQRVAGAFFAFTGEEASKYARGPGGRVLPVFLQIKNPADRSVLDSLGYSLNGVEMRNELIRRGYDGVVDRLMKEIVVFDPTQIKSVNNRGTFSPTDPNILRQTGTRTDSPEFRAWFGESKVVDEKGQPIALYHQTTAESASGIMESGFDINRPTARATDAAVPDGVFLKPDSSNIRMAGDRQIPVFARMENPLRFLNRAELLKWARKDKRYAELADHTDAVDRDGAARIDALSDSRPSLRGGASDAEVSKWNAEEDALIEEVGGQLKSAAAMARARLTELIREAGHDGLVIEHDAGSLGRSTKTFVVLDPTQVKSPYNQGTFSPTDPNILRQGETKGTFYDEEFQTVGSLVEGLRDGRLLVHARVHDETDFQYGIEPSAGKFLRSTEAWQTAKEMHGEGPELTFFSDSLSWAESAILKEVRGATDKPLDLVFVRKSKTIQKSLGSGRVETADGKNVNYELSPMGDYENPLFKGEPAGVETGDWYTNKTQDVVAVVPASSVVGGKFNQGETLTPDALIARADAEYKLAGDTVDGREVLPNVDNTASIGAELYDYHILPGIREIPTEGWGFTGKSYSVSETKRIEVLAEKIRESGKISPLIIVERQQGPYILEGGHRAEALHLLGAKSFPAMVVVDTEEPSGNLRQTTKGTFDPRDLTIALTESADLSTLLHELGHYYLHTLGQLAAMPEATRAAADFQTFATWAGVKDLAAWNAMSLDEQRPHHEAFARSFEIFLHEGKAPSAELRTLFERFRAWLVSVYRDIVGRINENYRAEFGRDLPALTPEVRGVMGRLVAADEAIAKGEAVRDMKPLFQTLEESGMTAEEFAAYEQSIAEAHEASVTDLSKASLRQMQWLTGARNRLTKQLQSKNEKLRREAEREVGLRVSGEPIYRAIRWLRKGDLLNEDGTKAQGDRDPNHRLNRAAVEAMLPGVDLAKLEGLTIEKGGLAPDFAAEALGFTSGEAMLKAILEAPTLAERIETEADALMLERHGDMATPEAREAAVEEALHNEARMRFVATELRWLEKGTQPVRIMVQAAQEAAREAIAALPVRQLTPRTFALAEARSARLAAKEAKAGNMVEAVRAKRQQLLHSHMAAEALRARREVDGAKGEFKRFFRADEKLAKTRNVDFVNAGRAVLAWYGLGPKGDKPPGAYVKALREYNPTLYAEIEPTLARVVDTPRDYRDLTVDEFRALVVTVDALWDASKRSRQVTIEGQKRELAEVAGEAIARLTEIGVPAVLPGETADVTKGQRAIRGIHQLGAALKRVEHWADTMDGGKSGPFTRYLWRPVQDAVNAYRLERNKKVKAYVELLGTIEWTQGKIDAPELGYTFGTDNGGGGMETLLGALLHTGNESNFRKLLLGRKWGDVDAEGALVTNKWDAFIARMIAEGRLTKEHFDWVQKVWDLTESLKPEAQKAWHEINGFYFKEVEASARTITFKDGSTATYRGGYVPAKVDGFIVRDADAQQKMAELEADFRNSQPSVPSGFGKSRVEGYTKALSLDVRKIAAHLDQVVRFIHVQPAIRNVLKVLKAVEPTLSRVDSTAVNDLILPWLNRAAQQQTMEGDPSNLVNKFWNAVRKRTGMSAMFANLSNALQQVTGYFPAALKVAPRYLKAGLAAYAKDYKGTTAEVAGRSEWMQHRLENQTFEIAEQMNDLLINPTKFDKVKKWSDRHAYFLQSAFQNQVDVVTWLGAYNQAIEQQGAIDPNIAEREAVQKADAAVRLTQGSRDPESLARFEASTPFVKLFTQFSGYFNMLANLNASEYRKLFRELGWGAFGRKGAGRLAMLYVLGFGAPTLIADAIAKTLGGKWDDEEDDGYSDDLAQWFFAANAKGLVGMVPGFGPAVNAVVRGVTSSNPYDDRMSLSPSIQALEAATFGVAKTAENVAQGKLSGRNVRDVLTLLTLLTGVPVSALGKPLGYAMDAEAGKIQPTGPVDYGRGLLTGIASEASR